MYGGEVWVVRWWQGGGGVVELGAEGAFLRFGFGVQDDVERRYSSLPRLGSVVASGSNIVVIESLVLCQLLVRASKSSLGTSIGREKEEEGERETERQRASHCNGCH